MKCNRLHLLSPSLSMKYRVTNIYLHKEYFTVRPKITLTLQWPQLKRTPLKNVAEQKNALEPRKNNEHNHDNNGQWAKIPTHTTHIFIEVSEVTKIQHCRKKAVYAAQNRHNNNNHMSGKRSW